MSSLQAIQSYESSSSESEEQEDDHIKKADVQEQKPKKGPDLPSVPSEILGMFDNSASLHPAEGHSHSSMHGGRIRSFDHVAGSWATLVHIQVELTEQLKTIMEDVLSIMPSSVDMEPVSDFHISLSRTVTLQYQWIDPFVESIRQRLASFDGFSYHFQDVEFYSNDEKTRSFVGLKVNYGHQEMLKLVEIIDVCLKEFSLPVYYEQPSFHVSFGWCLGDYQQFLSNGNISEIQEEFKNQSESNLPIAVNEIWCKAGCKQFRIPLGT